MSTLLVFSLRTLSVWFVICAFFVGPVSHTMAQAPVITTAPLTKLVVAGQPVNLTVAATGSGLTYQWKRNGQAIVGATAATYAVTSATTMHGGCYQAIVTNGSGSAMTVCYINVVPDRGTLVQWDVSGGIVLPLGAENLAAIAPGYIDLGLRKDGTVFGGAIYPTLAPAGLTNVVAVAIGFINAVALKADGTVVSWGQSGQLESLVPPTGLSGVVAIAAGSYHSVALKSDGTVVAWGQGQYGRTTVPPDLVPCVAITASGDHSLALRADGTVVGWGSNDNGQSTVPVGLSNVIAISEASNAVALKADGTVVAWGGYGGTAPVVVPPSLVNVMAVAAGGSHNLALKADGSVVGWGSAPYVTPTDLGAVFALATYGERNYAIVSYPDPYVPVTPVAKTVDVGATVTFSGGAAGTVPFTYRWQRNGTDLSDGPNVSGATTGYLTLTNVQVSDAGSYTLKVSNTVGISTSAGARLTVNVPPTIVTQPSAQFVNLGESIAFTVVATGPGPQTYQWRKNGVALSDDATVSGALTATLTISNAQTSAAGAYSVVVSNPATSVTSVDASLTVVTVPAFSVRPLTRLASVGQALTFSATTVGPGTITYQWKRNGRLIVGATTNTLAIASVSLPDRGFYEILATNSYGTAESVFQLNVVGGAVGRMSPVQWSTAGGVQAPPTVAENFVALAAGGSSLALRPDGTVLVWDGVSTYGTAAPPAGLADVIAVSSSRFYALALKADGTPLAWGAFYATVPAGLGTVVALSAGERHAVYLKADGTVVDTGSTSPPSGLGDVVAVAAGSTHGVALKADGTVVAWGGNTPPAGLSGVMAIAAGNAHSLALKTDGTVIAWGSSSEGQADVPSGLTNVVAIAAGRSHSLALKADGSVVSWGRTQEGQVPTPMNLSEAVLIAGGEFGSVALARSKAPVIVEQPVNRGGNFGQTASFSVVASAMPFPTYQWKKNGVALTDGGNISGATTATLTVSNGQTSDNAGYSVVVTNLLGTVESAAATLTSSTPPTFTVRPLSQIATAGQTVSFSAAATAATAVTYQWKHNGRAIAGATGSTLSLANVRESDSGYYQTVATSALGAWSTSVFMLRVAPANGRVFAWGSINTWGQQDVPAGLTDVRAIAAGSNHSLALKSDGTVVAWGDNSYGQRNVPAGLASVVAISAGTGHGLALKGDGSVVAWGDPSVVPAGLTEVVAIAAGAGYSMALKADGTVVSWGASAPGNGLTDIVGIAASGSPHALALKADGKVVDLGGTYPIDLSLSGVIAIAAGLSDAGAALKSDGTVASWAGIYSPPPELSGVVAVALRLRQFYALRTDGSVVTWNGFDDVPAGLIGVSAIAVGEYHRLGLIAGLPPVITSQPVSKVAAVGAAVTFSVVATGMPPLTYRWSRNGTDLANVANAVAGAQSATLSLSSVKIGDGGTYVVSVTGPYGTATSVPVTLSGTNPAPSITTAPQATSVVAGQNVTLSVAASGLGSLTYQWRRNSVDLPGATGSTLNLGAATLGTSGTYEVVVADGLSTTVSAPVSVQVTPSAFPQVITLDQTVGAAFEESGGNVSAFVRAADGRVLVVGAFSRVHGTPGRNLAWLKADGSGAAALAPLAIDGAINAAALQTDGKIIIGGTFRSVGGQLRPGLARLNVTGTLDLSFVPTADFTGVYAVAVQPSGKIVVGGVFAARLARVNSDGSTDGVFAPAPNSSVYALLALSDGRVVAGGAFTQISGQSSSAIARLNDNGTLDPSFATGSGFNGIVYALKGASGERVVVGGGFTSYNGAAAGRIVRLTSGGSVDAGWSTGGSGFNSTVYSVDVQSDGKVVAAGAFGGFNATSQTAVARLLATGALDPNFHILNFTQAAVAVTYLDNGSVIAGGSFVRDGGFGTTATGIALFNTVGTLGFAYSPGLMKPSSVNKLVRLADGRVIAGGPFVYVNGVSAPYLARLSSTGVLDTTFTTNEVGRPSLPIEDMLVQPDGKLVVVGDFGAYKTTFINKIARINSDGGIDPSFRPPDYFNGTPDRVAQLPGGRLLVALKSGTVVSGTAVRRDSLMVLNPDGTIDSGFTVAPVPSGEISSMLAQSDGKIVVGGSFRTFNGAPCDFIVRLLPSGARDPGFVARTDDNVLALALQPDGKILLAGDFLAVDDVPRARVARLLSGGELDTTFNPQFALNGSPTLLALEPGGRVIISGPFDYVNNHPVLRYLFRAQPNGALDSSFAAPGLTSPVTNIVLTEDGSPWLAGGELQLGGLTRSGLLRSVSSAGPVILAQPVGGTIPAGSAVTLSVSVAGGDNVTYQWFKNGTAISGATGPRLSTTSILEGDSGNYIVRVTHGGGTFDSATAALLVNPSAPILAASDVAGFGGAIKSGSRWALVAPVVAAGSPPITFQWSKDGVAIPGATSRTYWTPGWQNADDGVYRVAVSNGSGTVSSNPFTQHVTALPDWNWRLPLPQGNSLFAMTYLNGRFVGGGSRGTVLTSLDGAAWTVSRLGVSNSVLGFAYGNGVYVAITSYGGVWMSSDATAWTQRDAEVGADGRYFSSIAFGGGRFVAVGDRGLIATSSNGVTWSLAAAGTTDNLGAVSFGGGRFVALGSSGRALISTDGMSWSAGGVLRRPASLLAYGAGRFVAITGKQLFTSADGQAWAQQTLDTTASATGLQYSDVGFLLTLDSIDGKYWSSGNGLDWSRQSLGLTQNAAAYALSHGSNRYVMAGPASESLMTSSDGQSWERSTPSFALNFTAVAAGPSSLVAIGQRAAVKISIDGSITSQALNISDYDKPMDIVFGAGMYVAVFSAGGVWTSSDGQSWSGSSNSSHSYTGVSFANDRFFVLGTNGVMLTASYAGAPTANTGTSQTLFKTAYGAGVYVTVGANGTVLSSNDGTSWTPRNSNGITSNIYDVIYAAGKFVLVSEGASIRTSTDGVTWVAQVNPLGAGLKSLAFGGGKIFAFTTSNTNYLMSPDGVTWTVAQHGSANATADAVAFGNNLYLVGANASITSAWLGSPAVVTHPLAQNKVLGDSVTFSVALSDAGPYAYQWFKNGVAISGANFATLTLNNITAVDAGAYTVSVTNHVGTTTSAAAALAVESRGLINASARANVGTGPATLTGVFTVEGTTPKQMLIRAAGPMLAGFGVSGALLDPQLVIEDLATGAAVASNDDWGAATNSAQIAAAALQAGAVPFSNGSKDAAILATFSPGSYRARVVGAGATTGLATIEIFDADSIPRLVYLGTRARVGTGDGALVQGFALAAVAPGRSYLIRALGPSLGLPGALADPQLAVFSGSTQLAANDNGGGDSSLNSLTSSVGAMQLPSGSKDAALNFTPPAAGAFTVQVSGVGGTSGLTLLEIFESDTQRSTTMPLAVVSAPENISLNAGQPAALGVVTVGKPAATYQWSRNGTLLAGATSPLLSIPSAQVADAGAYSVLVSNGGATAFNASATLSVSPLNNATHAFLGGGYAPGGAVTVTNTVYFVGAATSLDWSVTLPVGWSFLADGGTSTDVKPGVGATGTLTWKWTNSPVSPVTFTYTVAVPAGESVTRSIAASAAVTVGGVPQTISVAPGALQLRPVHSADTDGDGRMGLFELTRVIELYNARVGTTRTGRYRTQVGTEDGFAPDLVSGGAATISLTHYHSADTNRDGRVSLVELTRVIELFNTRSGTTRTGAYHVSASSEDGFAPGP